MTRISLVRDWSMRGPGIVAMIALLGHAARAARRGARMGCVGRGRGDGGVRRRAGALLLGGGLVRIARDHAASVILREEANLHGTFEAILDATRDDRRSPGVVRARVDLAPLETPEPDPESVSGTARSKATGER